MEGDRELEEVGTGVQTNGAKSRVKGGEIGGRDFDDDEGKAVFLLLCALFPLRERHLSCNRVPRVVQEAGGKVGDRWVAWSDEGGANGCANGGGFGVASQEIKGNHRDQGINQGPGGNRGGMRLKGSQSSTEGNLFGKGISSDGWKDGDGDGNGGVRRDELDVLHG